MMLQLFLVVALTAAGLAYPGDVAEVVEGGVKCGKWTVCGANARCTKTNGYDDCVCQDGFFGSGYAGCTSEPECKDNEGCEEDRVCKNNLCVSPCHSSCPADVGCKVKNHVAECIFDGTLFFDPPPSSSEAPGSEVPEVPEVPASSR